MPIRGGYAKQVFYRHLRRERCRAPLPANIACATSTSEPELRPHRGLILNSRNIEREYELVKELADEIGTEILQVVPRSAAVQQAEEQGKTVVEAFPDSEMAREYHRLAARILEASKHEEDEQTLFRISYYTSPDHGGWELSGGHAGAESYHSFVCPFACGGTAH
jgi:nitrogenase iron protein NifH